MACGCKQKPEEPKPQVINLNGVTEIIEPTEPPYTREEINRAYLYLNGINNSPDERRWTMNFHNQHSQEQLIPTCSSCWPRVKARIDNMNQKLNYYEQYKASR